ncbi:hypothetical protein [Methylocaldum sp. RMAD-M]|jgi:predicted kinase|uniref:hypothetical protein n=1 Tax=Methylocaldum sp. RMAD-M TaxID=2806557 RepID=UPI001AE1D07B|nr:hypothetical protein [Methylocaldum sp. RMAD-M]MBP1152717.1 putative kinase [Methylocaldum sp. RMAD-M]
MKEVVVWLDTGSLELLKKLRSEYPTNEAVVADALKALDEKLKEAKLALVLQHHASNPTAGSW